MKSLSKLFLLVVLLTTQQSILSFKVDMYESGPTVRLYVKNKSKEEKQLLTEEIKAFLLTKYGKSISIKEEDTSYKIVVRGTWKEFNCRNHDEMTTGIKAVTFVINLATRALEKC